MSVTQPPATVHSGTWRRLPPSGVKIMAAVLAVVVSAVVGYLVGSHRRADGHVLVGRAYVSPYQAAVKVDGWIYGFKISGDGMEWYDTHGARHKGGVPPCLKHSGHAWIRFGWSTAHGLHDSSRWRTVDWVQCVHTSAQQ